MTDDFHFLLGETDSSDTGQEYAPVPQWHTVEEDHLFGFWMFNRIGGTRFIQQIWTAEHERLRNLAHLTVGSLRGKEVAKYERAVRGLPILTLVRHRVHGYLAFFSGYNLHGIGEFIATYKGGEKSSEFIRDYVPVDGRWPDG